MSLRVLLSREIKIIFLGQYQPCIDKYIFFGSFNNPTVFRYVVEEMKVLLLHPVKNIQYVIY